MLVRTQNYGTIASLLLNWTASALAKDPTLAKFDAPPVAGAVVRQLGDVSPARSQRLAGAGRQGSPLRPRLHAAFSCRSTAVHGRSPRPRGLALIAFDLVVRNCINER